LTTGEGVMSIPRLAAAPDTSISSKVKWRLRFVDMTVLYRSERMSDTGPA